MKENYMILVGQRIASARKARGLTIKEVAAQAHPPIDPSTWGNYEVGLRGPKIDTLIRMSKALRVSLSYLAGIADSMSGDDAAGFTLLTGGEMPAKAEVKYVGFNADKLAERGFKDTNLLALNVRDNSIKNLSPGDAVFIDTSVTYPKSQGIFAIKTNSDQTFLRYIRPELDGTFTMLCDDKNQYPDMTMTAEEIKKLPIVGKKIGHIHWDN